MILVLICPPFLHGEQLMRLTCTSEVVIIDIPNGGFRGCKSAYAPPFVKKVFSYFGRFLAHYNVSVWVMPLKMAYSLEQGVNELLQTP